MLRIFPSLISSDLLNLERTIKQLDPHCPGYHIDIMDDHFVPNLTWGHQFANAIDKATPKTVWVHLMIQNTQSMISRLDLKPSSMVTIHTENNGDIARSVSLIKDNNWLPGIAISPKTGAADIFKFLNHDIDHVLIMSVEPGFSGQEFIPATADKIEPLIEFRKKFGLTFTIGIDGGIHAGNIAELAKRGVESFGVASGIFAHKNPVEALQNLSNLG